MERLGWLANFDRVATGTTSSERPGWSFSDSEVYKLIEALCWEYGASGRPDLDEAVRRLTRRIAPAQDEDGYLNTYYQFVVSAGKPDLKSLDELKGKVVASNKGSAYDKWLQDNAGKLGLKAAESYGTNADAMQAVISGRADAGLTGNTVAAYAVLRSNKQLKLVPLKVDQGLVWGAAFRKDDAATRNAVEEAIECMKMDGTVAKLHEKWFGLKPEKGSAALTVYPGYGVPGMDGHDPKPHTPKCK
jgi:polar amino acid transport system substrate-binding protein